MNNLENRKVIVIFTFILVGFIFTLRLLYMQVFSDKWQTRAAQISEYRLTQYAPRGIIYDRNDKKLVQNSTFYDITVTISKTQAFDTVALAQLLDITPLEIREKIKAEKNKYLPFTLVGQIKPDQFYIISEQLPNYPGFSYQQRILRGYAKPIGAHFLGYIGEVDKTDLKENAYYRKRDYKGKRGLEYVYEVELRGVRGVRYFLKDAIGLETGSFENGKYDTAAVRGQDLFTSIDSDLQAFGEELMQNKIGSIVAIDPQNGEILAMVSAPSYDPNLLTGREMPKNYITLLRNDSLRPLYNRAVQALYPPGSVFKIAQALVGLQEKVITENSGFPCNKNLVGCHDHTSCGNLYSAISQSCNPYFYRVGQRIMNQNKSRSTFKDTEIGLGLWEKYMRSFGFGNKLETDLPSVKKGMLPSINYYDKIFRKGQWAYSTIYSVAIGQGEVQVNPLQIANFAAIIANKGYYYTPHFVTGINKKGNIDKKYTTKNYCMVNAPYFEPIIEAMQRAIDNGTGKEAQLKNIKVCGKTGTAQNNHGEDHSVFLAFAPREKPKIAIAIIVENAGWGGSVAAPIAGLLMEKYLTGKIADKAKAERMKKMVLLDRNVKRTNTGGLKQHQKSKKKKRTR